MGRIEQHLFTSPGLTQTEIAEIEKRPYAALLQETFYILSTELNNYGHTKRLREQREKYSAKLLAFWGAKLKQYDTAITEGLIDESDTLDTGDEKTLIQTVGEAKPGDEATIIITREALDERDEFRFTINNGQQLDSFLRPPTLRAEIQKQPGEAANLIFDVTFRNGLISTIQRVDYIEDPKQERPSIKQTRELDFSSLDLL